MTSSGLSISFARQSEVQVCHSDHSASKDHPPFDGPDDRAGASHHSILTIAELAP
jgi:hypothetical protein